MFTGIIEALGQLSRREAKGGDATLVIDSGRLDLAAVKPGDSIAVNGVCLTVTSLGRGGFAADMSVETLQRSCLGELPLGSEVNLEQALTPSSPMGGHIVTGHVDALGIVQQCEQRGRAIYFAVQAPEKLSRYIAAKGSIAVDGVSLTVNGLVGDCFELMVIPHTLGATIIPAYTPGRRVHLEVDIMARYAERLMQHEDSRGSTGLSLQQLADAGFIC